MKKKYSPERISQAEIYCPACRGTGRRKGKICYQCQGSGRLYGL